MKRIFYFTYGALAYAGFGLVALYLIGFMGNFLVPKSIDSGTAGPVGPAMLVDTLLIALFGLQHTVMARPGFKRWWTRFVPEPIERSTYVMITNVIFAATFYFWQPIPNVVWSVTDPAASMVLWVLFASGWIIVVASTFAIDHFDLFGMKQVTRHLLRKTPVQHQFAVKYLYKIVRHPLMLGWLIAFWFIPIMTVGHLLFAVLQTVYILIALHYEEIDLVEAFGDDYRTYQQTVPKLIPFAKAAPTPSATVIEG